VELEKIAEEVLPGKEGGWGKRAGLGQGGQMTQTMYAHMNKYIFLKKAVRKPLLHP
jgi:hypothetical protein